MLDVVALSGAHTVGFAHCTRFADRLYNFSSTLPVDPSLNPVYAEQLEQVCPPHVDPTMAVNMDPVTPVTFDSYYYKNLVDGLGLFRSDEVLYTDNRTKSAVDDFAGNQSSFFAAFAHAMVKLGRVGVKAGKLGQIRRDCTTFN